MYLGVKWRQIESFWTTAHPCNKQPHVNNLQIQNQMCVHTHCGNPNSDAFIGKLHSSTTFKNCSGRAMFLSLFQSRRAADNSDWHSLIVLHLPWFGSETTSHWGEPKASGAYGAFVLSGLAKIWNWIFIVLMSQQPSNTFRGGSPHSWLVNTCSWHWLLNEPLLQPNRDILLKRHQSEGWGSLEPQPNYNNTAVWIKSNSTRSQLEQSWHLSSTKGADRDAGS